MRFSPRHSVLQTHTQTHTPGGRTPAWWSPPPVPVSPVPTLVNSADIKGLRQGLALLAQTVTAAHIQLSIQNIKACGYLPAEPLLICLSECGGCQYRKS